MSPVHRYGRVMKGDVSHGSDECPPSGAWCPWLAVSEVSFKLCEDCSNEMPLSCVCPWLAVSEVSFKLHGDGTLAPVSMQSMQRRPTSMHSERDSERTSPIPVGARTAAVRVPSSPLDHYYVHMTYDSWL